MSRLTEEEKTEIRKLHALDYTQREIGLKLGRGKSTIGDYIRSLPVELEEVVVEEDIEELCESPDWDVANLAKRLRTAQRTNSQLRRTLNAATDVSTHIPDMIKAVEKATRNVSLQEPTIQVLPKQGGTEDAIIEILLSDYQIGKVGQYFNSKLAEQAMKKYGKAIQEVVYQTALNYNPKKIVLALLGDLVEDHLKHGVQSATSTDCGLSEQMALAIEHLWEYIIQPLSQHRIEMEVICIAGNHGSSQHKGMDMFKAGLYSYDYTIFKALEG